MDGLEAATAGGWREQARLGGVLMRVLKKRGTVRILADHCLPVHIYMFCKTVMRLRQTSFFQKIFSSEWVSTFQKQLLFFLYRTNFNIT